MTALVMLCGLGAPIYATTIEGRRYRLVACVAGFALALYFGRNGVLPNPSALGLVVAGCAALEVFRPRWSFLSPVCAGVLTAIFTMVLRIQGVPTVGAIAIALVFPIVAGWLASRRDSFAPRNLREEAMLLMIALGILVAVIPEVSEGWRSAMTLNRDSDVASTPVIASWALVFGTTSALLGGVYSLLRRR